MCPDFETLIYEKKDGVAVISLNRPEVLNALNKTQNWKNDEVIEN